MKNKLTITQTPKGFQWSYSNGPVENPVVRVVATTEEGLIGLEYKDGTRQMGRLLNDGVILPE